MLPLHATALGKAVLAYLDDDVADDLLGASCRKLTGHTLDTRGRAQARARVGPQRGFALEREEAVIGEAGVAAPIFDRRTRARGRGRHRGPARRGCSTRGREPRSPPP